MLRIVSNSVCIGLAGLALALAPMVASAESSGSFSITVTIPPFAAGFQAASEGAVGLSTLDQPGGGLLISAPSEVQIGDSSDVKVFSQNGSPVSMRVAGSDPTATPSNLASVSGGAATPFNGMTKTTFTVAPSAAAAASTQVEPVVSLVVSSI